MKVGKDGLMHRIRAAGVMIDGSLERLGARGTTINRYVTCQACLEIIRSRQIAAKARNLPVRP